MKQDLWFWFCETWKNIARNIAVGKIILAATGIGPPFTDDPDRVQVRQILTNAGMDLNFEWELAEAVASYYRESIGL